MRITVISDSHRNTNAIRKILNAENGGDTVFFLGDVTADIEEVMHEYPNKTFNIVSGNCDFFSAYPASGVSNADGHNIFYTHGHTLSVKYGTERLIAAARERNGDIALYGHTHISKILSEDGVYVVNPGSCSSPREGRASYAVIDIEKNGIMPIIINI